MPETATLDQLMEFANKVREAGGGNPLDALMPAVPKDPRQCLIAKNLNFNCVVNTEGPRGEWVMIVSDEAVRDKIAAALHLKKHDFSVSDGYFSGYAVILPKPIGRVAEEFDCWANAILEEGRYNDTLGRWEPVYVLNKKDRRGMSRLKRFWPYVEASEKEAFSNTSFVNDKGELVL